MQMIAVRELTNRARDRTLHLYGFWLQFKKNRAAVLGLGLVLFLTLGAILAPLIFAEDPRALQLDDPTRTYRPPGWPFLMGTDQWGRDVFNRVAHGARVSLAVGFSAAMMAGIIGIIVGAFSGYYGGRLDDIVMRFVDMLLMIPSFFLIILIAAVFGGSTFNLVLIIGGLSWPQVARLVRAEFLSKREEEYVLAAEMLGLSKRHIIFREILPNAIYVAVVNVSLLISYAILYESSLSFLGVGDPNLVTWGWMVKDAMRWFRSAWWVAVFPGLAISVTVLAFNLVGDGLNDALNPRLRVK
jgi:peptide/nickel transport system permease protein